MSVAAYCFLYMLFSFFLFFLLFVWIKLFLYSDFNITWLWILHILTYFWKWILKLLNFFRCYTAIKAKCGNAKYSDTKHQSHANFSIRWKYEYHNSSVPGKYNNKNTITIFSLVSSLWSTIFIWSPSAIWQTGSCYQTLVYVVSV